MTVNEIIQKIIDAGMADALQSEETAVEAAKKLGFSDEEIQQALESSNQELSDDELENIAGGDCGGNGGGGENHPLYVT